MAESPARVSKPQTSESVLGTTSPSTTLSPIETVRVAASLSAGLSGPRPSGIAAAATPRARTRFHPPHGLAVLACRLGSGGRSGLTHGSILAAFSRSENFCLTSDAMSLRSRPGHMKWSKRYKPQYLAIACRWTCPQPFAPVLGIRWSEGLTPKVRSSRYRLLRNYTPVHFVRPVCGRLSRKEFLL